MSIKNQELLDRHLIILDFPIEKKLHELVLKREWDDLDRYFLAAEKPEGELFQFLSPYLDFKKIEHIIAIRASSPGYQDEDGIWHDDGSRILGFSLSLTLYPEDVKGGHLRFKPKGSESFINIPTQSMGKIILFKTGIYGFEHMVSAVEAGERVVIAGWCS